MSLVAKINLEVLGHNYQKLCSLGKEVAAVVKANAYGLGVKEVSERLSKLGCGKFFVATLDEAVELRGILPDASIYVLNGIIESQIEMFKAHNFIPVINSIKQNSFWKDKSVIHVDTGMNRLGVSFDDFEKINYDNVEFVLSHLSCSDDKSHCMNEMQLKKFQHVIEKTGKKASFANSAAIFLGGEYHFDILRPGIAIYGVNPHFCDDLKMKPVVGLFGEVLQVSYLNEADYVGYGATHKCIAGQVVATISGGYADGFSTHLSDVGECFVNGEKAKIIGRLSMDSLTISQFESKIKVGDQVEFFGENQAIEEFAKQSKMIPYNVLTQMNLAGISNRIIRIYS